MTERTITIKGQGQASARPDEIHILLALEARRQDYAETMALAARQHEALLAALAPCGIKKEEVKTTAYNVGAVYENERGKDGNYVNRFKGYRCGHDLRVAIPLDMARLGEILAAVAGCTAEPQLNLRFTVCDTEALKDEVLRSACANANHRAALLAEAAGVRLGALLHIDYSWGEAELYSPTNFARPLMAKCDAATMAIEPEDVQVSDTVTFTWQLEA